jgi:2-polyprenyl-6-hydroxyphenyl methylase/3-demethylubiquinone-9 3-methyltransferase
MTGFGAVPSLQPVAGPTTPCKICSTESALFDVVDYHEDCYEANGRRMTLSGIPIYYYRCPGCGFLFTRAFDGVGGTEPLNSAGPDDGSDLGPELAEVRRNDCLPLLMQWFGEELNTLRLLDLSDDPLSASLSKSRITARPYDIILARHIFEQETEPLNLMRWIDRMIAPDGLLLVATPLNDGVDADAAGLRRRPLRYVSPLRRQYSIFNAASLALALGSVGFRLAGFRQGIHIGLRALPRFAEHLFESRSRSF